MCCSRKYPYIPHRRFFWFESPPPPLQKFQFSSNFRLKILAFDTPHPLRIFNDLVPWGGYGYVVELHSKESKDIALVSFKIQNMISSGTNVSIKKSNKCLYFWSYLRELMLVTRTSLNCTVIRLALQHCSPIFHHSLPEYLSEDLKRIQKRALSITSPEQSYRQCLDSFELSTLRDRHNDHFAKLFNSISSGQHSLALKCSLRNIEVGIT